MGVLPSLVRDPFGSALRAWRQQGDIFALNLGSTRLVLLSHPRQAQYLLRDNAQNYHKGGALWDSLRGVLGNGLVVSEGDFWLRQRRLMQPQFHRHRLAERLLPILRAFAAENYYDRLGEIAVPCTVIYGLRDKTTPAFHSELIHQRIRSSQIVRVERVGHLFNWEAPEQIAAAIRSAADGAPSMSVLPGALIDARPWPRQSS